MKLLHDIDKSDCNIFLSYATPDLNLVCTLYDKLQGAGFTPWMDKKNILAGEKIRHAIRRAMEQAEFILICFSPASVDYEGSFQAEIKWARLILEMIPDSDARVIPIRLQSCNIPEPWDEYQWVDIFEEGGFEKLAKDMREWMKRRLLARTRRPSSSLGPAFSTTHE